MRSQNIAIVYSAILQQSLKLSADEAGANTRIYEIGRQVGLRLADQYSPAQCSHLNPADTLRSLLQSIAKSALGLPLTLESERSAIEKQQLPGQQGKKKYLAHNLLYRQGSGYGGSVLSLCEDVADKYQQLEPCWVVAGFLYGVLQSMGCYGRVGVSRGDGAIMYEVAVRKDIKDDD